MAPPTAHQRVHRARGHERGQRPGQLDRRGEARAQQVEQLSHVVGQRSVEYPGRIAEPQRMIGPPARPPGPVADGLIELHEEKDAVMGIVGVEEIARRGQRQHGGQRQGQQQPDFSVGQQTANTGHSPAIVARFGRKANPGRAACSVLRDVVDCVHALPIPPACGRIWPLGGSGSL